jgi:DNA-binding response OmpR family regulator
MNTKALMKGKYPAVQPSIMARGEHEAVMDKHEKAERMEGPKQHTILVIEDDPRILSMIQKHLAYEGYAVITARDGMEGLKKLESEAYDLVITDIVMPYVSGVGVVTAVKEKRPHVPVIAITGYGKEPESAATEKKADLVMAKPVKMSALKDQITQLLSHPRTQGLL